MRDERLKNDEKYMQRCLHLARCGEVGAAPNPMVGAVVVHNGRIIGEGFHRRCGGPHAEVNAIASVHDPSLLPDSTIYVSLEPCAHFGKTPPCADLIIEKGIKRIVVGCRDSFDKVDGLGIQKLRDAGREVTVGVLEQECLDLNRRFFTFHTKKRPYITLKWAQSADGFIARKGERTTLSTSTTMTLVHRLRALNDAILVGGQTVVVDNPSLTVREWTGKNPLRIVVDTRASLKEMEGLRSFDTEAETLVWTNWNLDALMEELYHRGVQRLLVEGGATTLRRFLKAGLWDEARIETASVELGGGIAAPMLSAARLVKKRSFGSNTVYTYRPVRTK
ncbi:MAG: bifunctional diaminohydroxyphosphoribosylaminopyrimidine deaminase/5-amino-6-(5-phosphoribosylamino)uracil reductase RibD [Bacteroidales bacterium]|nr:bifunctional diaminohydroxyphosphoribosylaminopyrimidine deaminase/5-amino-6-(5-phosphoribosylamino)uracil reductase RibD [Candidatus Physcousia equi]